MTDDGEQDGWHKKCDLPEFKKWGYKDSPYRLIADLDDTRGHWRVLFTSVYGNGMDAYLVAGNLGGGTAGKMKALAHARKFIRENKYGCPPPGEYPNGD